MKFSNVLTDFMVITTVTFTIFITDEDFKVYK